jgi:uncharacterized zinc-type alcohol dehydrogenase-like protein
VALDPTEQTAQPDHHGAAHEAVGTIIGLDEQAKGLKIGQRVGVGWSAYSCLSCHQCLSGDHHLCMHAQGTIGGRYGGFADRLRVQWTWARPLPDALDLAKAPEKSCCSTMTSFHFVPTLERTTREGVLPANF